MDSGGQWQGALTQRERNSIAVAVIVIHVLLGIALLRHYGADIARAAARSLDVIDVAPPPPPMAEARKAARRAGEAAPANIRQNPTPVVAPPPVLPKIIPVIPAAPIAGTGAASASGAAPVPGPGTGAGGFGNGHGAGGDGDGDGGGGTPPERIRGDIKRSDYPHGVGEAGYRRTVEINFRVDVDGRASDCRIERSSGVADLDATVCRLAVQRFRFRPARDGDGRPVSSRVIDTYTWGLERAEGARDDDGDVGDDK